MSEVEIECFEMYADGMDPDNIAQILRLDSDIVRTVIKKMLESYCQNEFSG
jgi:DNA-binding CsgD family transcriptional regulator